MQIDRIFFPATTLGYGNRIVIWTIGCPHRCYNCSNPELWHEDPSRDIKIKDLIPIISQYVKKTDGLTITGGEPFFQAKELYLLLKDISPLVSGDIIVYTGYRYEDILQNKEMQKCLKFIDVLIDGKYVDKLNDNLGLRGSSNQRIIILNQNFASRYIDADSCKRKSQVVIGENTIINIGIPIIQK